MLDKQLVTKSVSESKSSEWEKLEKILLTVVGGTLAASSTFFVNKEIHFMYTWILALAWIFLSASLISLLLSYAFSEYFTSDLIKKLKNLPDTFSIETFEKIKSSCALLGVRITNYGALAFGILGIVTLALFAYLNISQ